MGYKLYIANKNYSSWSLRGWLVLKGAGIAFEEVKVHGLTGTGWNPAYLAFSPAGRVPCLHHDGIVVWDSLAIAEYLAERHRGLWPGEPVARAWARSICAEMHSGFNALRDEMCMCVRERLDVRPWSEALARDIARIGEVWRTTRERFGAGGKLLFGGFTIADAFFAPVAFRFRTYDVRLDGAAADYQRALLAHPAVLEWERDALAETEVIDIEEPRFVYKDKLQGKA